jgi:polyisoprenoid-binding protein YceI
VSEWCCRPCNESAAMPETASAIMPRCPHVAVALLVAFAPAAFVTSGAEAQTYRIAPERTQARFAVTQFGVLRQEWRFHRVSGTILLDPSRASGGRIDVAIDLASVDTGWQLRDDFIRGEDVFDVARYPVLEFRSTHLEYRDRQIAAAQGLVSLHGVTKPLRLDVRSLDCVRVSGDGGESCAATVSGQLLRREFGMDFAYPIYGDAILLDFAITALRSRNDNDSDGEGRPTPR